MTIDRGLSIRARSIAAYSRNVLKSRTIRGMTADIAETKKNSKPSRRPRPSDGTKSLAFALDAVVVLLFLGLVFLLGVFPLKDTDFWWHLRTGDIIRKTGVVPHKDIYTFTVPNNEWIDLHWGFQVAISKLYELGGVDATTLAKCVVTTLGMAILITARRRGAPYWAIVLAWLPALYVLSGRMYVRPETITFLYIAIFLAVLHRLRDRAALVWILPAIEVLWVNTQGLFVLGPILLGAAVLGAAFEPGAFAAERSGWWKTVLAGSVATGLACLVNPYFIRGALFPIALMKTMSADIFAHQIGELTPIPLFIRQLGGGFNNFPLRMHIATMLLGALSFVIPLCFSVIVRGADSIKPYGAGAKSDPIDTATRAESAPRSADASTKKKKNKSQSNRTSKKLKNGSIVDSEDRFRLVPFRVLIYLAFSALSWKATRNSHQFAAVVGAVTAWNFSEWVAAIAARRSNNGSTNGNSSGSSRIGSIVFPRAIALGAVTIAYVLVLSGFLYEISQEKRTVALGEEPFWFPHAAVKRCGLPGSPERFIGFNNGHVSLFEYYYGPERKVFVDARLEVIGAELFEKYVDLQKRISLDQGDWAGDLNAMGRPSVLTDHATAHAVGASLLVHPDWRCVWFDEIAAVYVHKSYEQAINGSMVDFGSRHFHQNIEPPRTSAEALAIAGAFKNYASDLAASERARGDVRLALVLSGIDAARRAIELDPDSPQGWKLRGLLEAVRDPVGEKRIPRYKLRIDPVFDLTTTRVSYNLNRAAILAPDDFGLRLQLLMIYSSKGMDEASLPIVERLIALEPFNEHQANYQKVARDSLGPLKSRLGPAPDLAWKNRDELERKIGELLDSGRVATAAELIEKSTPAEARSWEWTDRLGTLYLHLGEPAKARAAWLEGGSNADNPLRSARVGLTYLVEDRFDAARSAYQTAIEADPKLFEAYFGLASLELDAGNAPACGAAANKAAACAPGEFAARAALKIKAFAAPHGENRKQSPR